MGCGQVFCSSCAKNTTCFEPQSGQVGNDDRLQKLTSKVMFLQRNATLRRSRSSSGSTDAAPELGDTSEAGWQRHLRKEGHCSALVKITEGFADLMVGHTTWDDYSRMMRIFKYYNFPLGPETMATSIAMPSYPGALSSNDDYYVMNSGLVVMDTSLPQLTLNPYDDVKSGPVSGDIPTWMHLMITNRLSKRAADWAGEYIQRNNIGTYNNQFIIVEYNLFTPGKPLPDNTIMVV